MKWKELKSKFEKLKPDDDVKVVIADTEEEHVFHEIQDVTRDEGSDFLYLWF